MCGFEEERMSLERFRNEVTFTEWTFDQAMSFIVTSGSSAPENLTEVSRCELEGPMPFENKSVTVLLTEEHLRKLLENHLLQKDEIDDPLKLWRVVQKSLDTSLGLPDRPWHDWDEWARGL